MPAGPTGWASRLFESEVLVVDLPIAQNSELEFRFREVAACRGSGRIVGRGDIHIDLEQAFMWIAFRHEVVDLNAIARRLCASIDMHDAKAGGEVMG